MRYFLCFIAGGASGTLVTTAAILMGVQARFLPLFTANTLAGTIAARLAATKDFLGGWDSQENNAETQFFKILSQVSQDYSLQEEGKLIANLVRQKLENDK